MRFVAGEDFHQPSAHHTGDAAVDIDPQSERLQLLGPFKTLVAWFNEDMLILVKVKGKCTTDHASPEGPWYKYRGHVENMSNMLRAASNAFLASDSQLLGHRIYPLTSKVGLVKEVARDLRDHGVNWRIVGDDKTTVGSSREHAALRPRFLGGVAITSHSFASLNETNLKEQGILSLTIVNPQAYDRIQLGDRITLQGVEDGELRPGRQASMFVVRANNAGEWITPLNHSYSNGQLKWLRVGAL